MASLWDWQELALWVTEDEWCFYEMWSIWIWEESGKEGCDDA